MKKKRDEDGGADPKMMLVTFLTELGNAKVISTSGKSIRINKPGQLQQFIG